MTIRATRHTAAGIAGITAFALIAGCSSSGDNSGGGSQPTNSGSAAVSHVPLPSGYTGALVAPAVVGYPPYAYVEGGQTLGISVDVAQALSAPWGKQVTLKKDSFENSLLGVNRGTYFGVFGADVTADREKAFDQVSFLEDHYEFMTLADGPTLGGSMSDLCGKKISLVAAASSIPVLKQQSAKCTSQGKPAISILTFADQGSATLAVQSKQADATTATVTNLGYIAKQANGKFKLGGPRYLFVLIGIATKKGNGMAKAIASGINALIANGTYLSILKKYGVEAAAVKRAEVNPNPNLSQSS